MDQIAELIPALVREGFNHEFGNPRRVAGPDADWQRVREAGTTLWLDTGDMEEAASLWNENFAALTTNNTLLNREVQKGLYDELIPRTANAIRAAAPDIDEHTLVLETAFVLNAYHGLRLVEEFDARVSVELHTDLANDIERTLAYGRRYFAICPERFIVKVPLTADGLLGARKLVQDGIPINFTLGFSARQNLLAALVADTDWVNVFMGRLNSFVADHGLGSGENVGEKATLATQRALLELRNSGRARTNLIGASMREGSQVADLAGLDVFTMPPKVAEEFKQAPAATISSQVSHDPAVAFAEGVEEKDFGAQTLWEIPANLAACIESLSPEELDAMDGQGLKNHLRSAGIADLLPEWTEDELRTISEDGKIPVFETWRESLASGRVGLDALMNISALQSFATDQAALDNRIRSLI